MARIDHSYFNKIMTSIVYSLSDIDNLLANWTSAEFFSTIDLNSDYWQIRMEDERCDKVMPFGISITPVVFQDLINGVLEFLEYSAMLSCFPRPKSAI